MPVRVRPPAPFPSCCHERRSTSFLAATSGQKAEPPWPSCEGVPNGKAGGHQRNEHGAAIAQNHFFRSIGLSRAGTKLDSIEGASLQAQAGSSHLLRMKPLNFGSFFSLFSIGLEINGRRLIEPIQRRLLGDQTGNGSMFVIAAETLHAKTQHDGVVNPICSPIGQRHVGAIQLGALTISNRYNPEHRKNVTDSPAK